MPSHRVTVVGRVRAVHVRHPFIPSRRFNAYGIIIMDTYYYYIYVRHPFKRTVQSGRPGAVGRNGNQHWQPLGNDCDGATIIQEPDDSTLSLWLVLAQTGDGLGGSAAESSAAES